MRYSCGGREYQRLGGGGRASFSSKVLVATEGPMWGHPRPVLGAVDPFLEPFRGRLSPNIDNVSEKLTLRYPHEGPWVVPFGAAHARDTSALFTVFPAA